MTTRSRRLGNDQRPVVGVTTMPLGKAVAVKCRLHDAIQRETVQPATSGLPLAALNESPHSALSRLIRMVGA